MNTKKMKSLLQSLKNKKDFTEEELKILEGLEDVVARKKREQSLKDIKALYNMRTERYIFTLSGKFSVVAKELFNDSEIQNLSAQILEEGKEKAIETAVLHKLYASISNTEILRLWNRTDALKISFEVVEKDGSILAKGEKK